MNGYQSGNSYKRSRLGPKPDKNIERQKFFWSLYCAIEKMVAVVVLTIHVATPLCRICKTFRNLKKKHIKRRHVLHGAMHETLTIKFLKN